MHATSSLLFALLLSPSDRWPLDRLVEEALRANPQITSAQAAVESSRQQLTEAARAWWPNFSVESSVNPSVDVFCTDGNTGAVNSCLNTTNGLHNMQQAAPDGFNTRWELRMGWLLYGLGPVKHLAEQGVGIAEARYVATRQDLAVQVRRAYWSVQLFRGIRDMVSGARERIEQVIARMDEAVKKEKKLKETDRLRLVVQVSIIDTRIEDANKGERLSLAALRRLVPTAPADLPVDATLAPLELPDRPLSFYVDAARLNRPESKMLAYGTRAARYYVDFVRTQIGPQVLLLGSISGLVKTTDDVIDPSGPYMNHPFGTHGYGGGLFVRWELDFQSKLPRLRRAWQDWAAARDGAGAAEAGIALEVTAAYETVAETQRRMRILEQGDKFAARWLDLATTRFNKREADARELTDALLGWFDSHGNYLQAIFDFDAAVAQLGRTTGINTIGGKW